MADESETFMEKVPGKSFEVFKWTSETRKVTTYKSDTDKLFDETRTRPQEILLIEKNSPNDYFSIFSPISLDEIRLLYVTILKVFEYGFDVNKRRTCFQFFTPRVKQWC